jgi:hypothetical protein
MLGGLVWVKLGSDVVLIAATGVLLVAIFAGEWLFLSASRGSRA